MKTWLKVVISMTLLTLVGSGFTLALNRQERKAAAQTSSGDNSPNAVGNDNALPSSAKEVAGIPSAEVRALKEELYEKSVLLFESDVQKDPIWEPGLQKAIQEFAKKLVEANPAYKQRQDKLKVDEAQIESWKLTEAGVDPKLNGYNVRFKQFYKKTPEASTKK